MEVWCGGARPYELHVYKVRVWKNVGQWVRLMLTSFSPLRILQNLRQFIYVFVCSNGSFVYLYNSYLPQNCNPSPHTEELERDLKPSHSLPFPSPIAKLCERRLNPIHTQRNFQSSYCCLALRNHWRSAKSPRGLWVVKETWSCDWLLNLQISMIE